MTELSAVASSGQRVSVSSNTTNIQMKIVWASPTSRTDFAQNNSEARISGGVFRRDVVL